MNTKCKEFVKFIISTAPQHSKQLMEDMVSKHFELVKDRKVYHNDYFAVRFCYSKSSKDSFSNTILSLSALEKYDGIPFFVVLIRQNADNLILLANSTFLKKISHSSQGLSMYNIKGSFNGSDIMREYDGRSNVPQNFDYLFDVHQGLDWNDNLLRLVEATSNIQPKNSKFVPTENQIKNIFDSVNKAVQFLSSENFLVLEKDLIERCNSCKNEILIASHIENTNIRGRLIEALITANEDKRAVMVRNLKEMEKALPSFDTKNGLGDYYRHFEDEDTYTDIKTKIIYLSSNPKAYNVDKFLAQMADGRSVFLFFFIGIDENSVFQTVLCSVYHHKLMNSTILQSHWAGRSTRGVAQFHGSVIDEMLRACTFHNDIHPDEAKAFLCKLLER